MTKLGFPHMIRATPWHQSNVPPPQQLRFVICPCDQGPGVLLASHRILQAMRRVRATTMRPSRRILEPCTGCERQTIFQEPLIVWLQGGPGASGTGYGNFMVRRWLLMLHDVF